MTILAVAVAIFVLAALGGMLLSMSILRGRLPPNAVVMLHGAAGVVGIVLLILVMGETGFAGPVAWALGLFIVAALGGLAMVFQHRQGKLPGKGMVAGHALIAVAGLIALLVGAFG